MEQLRSMIIGAAIEVHKELGMGFTEHIYHQALLIVLNRRGIAVESEAPLNVQFRGHTIGKFHADILVEQALILELKACKNLLPEHQAQLINYLKATCLTDGLLLNFGRPRLQIKHVTHPDSPVGGGKLRSSFTG